MKSTEIKRRVERIQKYAKSYDKLTSFHERNELAADFVRACASGSIRGTNIQKLAREVLQAFEGGE